MKRSITGILLLAAVTFLTGCFSTTFSYSNRAPGRTDEVGRTINKNLSIGVNKTTEVRLTRFVEPIFTSLCFSLASM